LPRSIPPSVTLDPIGRDQASVLRNLFELYAHDFSEHVALELQETGRFDVAVPDVWWTSGEHHPFFIRHAGKLAGFALARRGSRVSNAPDVMDVAEFFVVRGERGRGVGTTVSHALFAKFAGPWEVRVRQANVPAIEFWSRAIEGWVGRPVASETFMGEGVAWEVLRLTSADRPPVR
jgi:predicted acetyltransferase